MTTITFDEYKAEIDKLRELVNHPKPGLLTWTTMFKEKLSRVLKIELEMATVYEISIPMTDDTFFNLIMLKPGLLRVYDVDEMTESATPFDYKRMWTTLQIWIAQHPSHEVANTVMAKIQLMLKAEAEAGAIKRADLKQTEKELGGGT